MKRITAPEKYILHILTNTARANVTSMAQLRQLPMLHRSLTSGMSLWLHDMLSQPNASEALRQAGLPAERAEMKALQRLLYRPVRFTDLACPTVAMDRILSLACTAGPHRAMAQLERFVRNTCADVSHCRRAV